MFDSPNCPSFASQIVGISRPNRWQVYHRLQELMIPCWCPNDGSLRVEVNNSIEAILVRSAVQQFMASRGELIDWLERCWRTKNQGYK
ncbi:Asr1405/Asl0597 family protein [Aerosakkonemataceae cyanobacterium BLCC-F154]|uniref:Asr1405/Asl0597 family protein n=1 Tax=Floridaenema fluviatile BLCC-F154 TaxID=3153640 RepID=A0ABV4YKE8_9CYAN